MLAAIYARGRGEASAGHQLGRRVAPESRPDPGATVSRRSSPRSISPATICCRGGRMPARRRRRPDPPMSRSARRLPPIIDETQRVTLAGFGMLDPQRHRHRRAARRSACRWPISRRSRGAAGQYRASVARLASATSRRRRSIRSAAAPACGSSSAMPVIVDDRVAGVVYLFADAQQHLQASLRRARQVRRSRRSPCSSARW